MAFKKNMGLGEIFFEKEGSPYKIALEIKIDKLCVYLIRVGKFSDHIAKIYKIFKVISYVLNLF